MLCYSLMNEYCYAGNTGNLHQNNAKHMRLHSQVVTADDNGALHLGRHDHAAQQLATDGNISSPGALLVDVNAVLGIKGGLEP